MTKKCIKWTLLAAFIMVVSCSQLSAQMIGLNFSGGLSDYTTSVTSKHRSMTKIGLSYTHNFSNSIALELSSNFSRRNVELFDSFGPSTQEWNTLNYLEFNAITFHNLNSKWYYGAGIGYDYLLKAKGILLNYRPDAFYRIESDMDAYKKFDIRVQMLVGYHITITEKLKLNIEAFFEHGLIKIYELGFSKSSPYYNNGFGISLGLNKIF